MNQTNVKSPALQIKSIMTQMVYTRSISVAADLGIADFLNDGAKSVQELSDVLKVDTEALGRLIRVLAAQGIFFYDKGLVSQTEGSELLRSDVPGSQRNFARMMGSPWMWKVFNNLEHSVTTGGAAFGEAFLGSDNLFLYFNQVNPEAGKIFSQAMSGFSYAFDEPLVSAYDFSDFNNIIDLGGAEGRLLKMIKERNPHLRTTLFELPHAIAAATAADQANELEFVTGDFKENITPGFDCYTIKYCLHNWDDEDTLQILKNIRQAMRNDSKLLIMDMLIEEQSPQVFEKSLDIVMLLLLGAKERTAEEFETLLDKAGLSLDRVISTKCPLSILEVSKK